MNPGPIADDLAHRLAAVIPDGLPEPIPTHLSLTRQLGLDSLVLMVFLAEVRADYGVDLGEWLIHQAAHGRDSLDTLAEHLVWAVDHGLLLPHEARAGSHG